MEPAPRYARGGTPKLGRPIGRISETDTEAVVRLITVLLVLVLDPLAVLLTGGIARQLGMASRPPKL
jgi:hypothetical protein